MGRDGALVFSIVVPTWNRPLELARCLGAIGSLDYPRERFEVIVVDDGGGVPLDDVIARFRGALHVTLLTQPHAGPGAARNTGVARAQGDVIALTDDDCLPEPQWLSRLAARLDGARAVGGCTRNGLPHNPYATVSQLITDVGYAYFNRDPDRAAFFATNNLALPADRFREIGGFDAALTTYEDRDLCERWLSRGWTMAYAPDAVVVHQHALTLASFWRQHFRYGCGALRFHRARAHRHPERVAASRIRPDPHFYRQLVRRTATEPGHNRTLLLTLVALAQAAGAVGFLRERLRQRA
jgi:glycosyltransferase involved in cell wall biosynthesis